MTFRLKLPFKFFDKILNKLYDKLNKVFLIFYFIKHIIQAKVWGLCKEKGEGKMKKIPLQMAKAVSQMALTITKENVNSLCASWFYQAKLPDSSEKLKKSK